MKRNNYGGIFTAVIIALHRQSVNENRPTKPCEDPGDMWKTLAHPIERSEKLTPDLTHGIVAFLLARHNAMVTANFPMGL
ncbi:MAG TPA: hypothetical protein PLO62_12015 [Candidatus Hydrogenedentes bacterium]|nr:hypothetical protein [Candidatus Hydrogenedentota bacterium]HOS04300.1 hypothetical protein [Candidatus Hydrogenedentota bacterium]